MDDLTASVQAAFESGINFFDTAATYGLGVSETILGKALGKTEARLLSPINSAFAPSRANPRFMIIQKNI